MRCFQLLNDTKAQELMELTNQLIAKLDRVTEKVNRASYGYSGFFDSVRIDAPQLDQMLTYDTQMMDTARKLADLVSDLKTQLSQNKLENIMNMEHDLENSISQLETMFDRRKSIIEGVTI
jgi:DNA repair ATPase RecN